MEETMDLNEIDTGQLADTGYRQMVSYLENILSRQIEKLRHYDLDGAMALAEDANRLAAVIGGEGVLQKPEFKDERWRIERLYKDLNLIIASERQEVQDKLRQIRQGIKTLGIYKENA